MALQCNIDARGKLVRLIYGVAFVFAGIVMVIAWAWGSGSLLAWVVSTVTLLGGAFAVFESRAGWCALRAIGIKTPL
jgi:hypothetical protein